MKKVKLFSIKIIPVFILIVSGFFIGAEVAGDDDLYEKINRNMDLFGQVYKEVALNYVDEIDADKFFAVIETVGVSICSCRLCLMFNYLIIIG